MRTSRHEKAIRAELDLATDLIDRLTAEAGAINRALDSAHANQEMLQRLLDAPGGPDE